MNSQQPNNNFNSRRTYIAVERGSNLMCTSSVNLNSFVTGASFTANTDGVNAARRYSGFLGIWWTIAIVYVYQFDWCWYVGSVSTYQSPCLWIMRWSNVRIVMSGDDWSAYKLSWRGGVQTKLCRTNPLLLLIIMQIRLFSMHNTYLSGMKFCW